MLWFIWKVKLKPDKEAGAETAIEYSHDFASGHIHLDLNFLWITFSIKVYLGWILALLQLWALSRAEHSREREHFMASKLGAHYLGFFVLLLLWVVTQNFSSQFHTLDYNTRFYGLTRQSGLSSRLRASFSHLAINKLRQLLRIFPWRAIKVRHFLLNLHTVQKKGVPFCFLS